LRVLDENQKMIEWRDAQNKKEMLIELSNNWLTQ